MGPQNKVPLIFGNSHIIRRPCSESPSKVMAAACMWAPGMGGLAPRGASHRAPTALRTSAAAWRGSTEPEQQRFL